MCTRCCSYAAASRSALLPGTAEGSRGVHFRQQSQSIPVAHTMMTSACPRAHGRSSVPGMYDVRTWYGAYTEVHKHFVLFVMPRAKFVLQPRSVIRQFDGSIPSKYHEGHQQLRAPLIQQGKARQKCRKLAPSKQSLNNNRTIHHRIITTKPRRGPPRSIADNKTTHHPPTQPSPQETADPAVTHRLETPHTNHQPERKVVLTLPPLPPSPPIDRKPKKEDTVTEESEKQQPPPLATTYHGRH